MIHQRNSSNDSEKRDIPSFIEPMPPLISNPYMRPRPQKGTNLLELFDEDSEIEEPELVQVYLRLKPHHAPTYLYEVKSDRSLITTVDTATAGHGRRTQHNVSKMYTFSHIFGSEATQKEVFEKVVKDNLKKLPEGHSFTLLTYGASGSGKTFTLMGTVNSPGLVPRSLEYVFRVVDAAQQPLFKPSDGGSDKLTRPEQDYELQWVKRLRHVSVPLRDKYRRMSAGLCSDLTVSSLDLSNKTRHYVWVSFVEIYNEGIYDLLSTTDRSNSSKLRIREDSNGHVYVKGATQAFVRSGEEAYDVMVAGKHNLQVAATGVHAQSSRSHCIFTITMLTETESGVRISCVRLCDLAGCERARRTRNTGARMAESRAINSSLHVLERCLHTLRRRGRCVPYRESKLTRLLGAGLSGAKGEAVSMVVTLNPAPEYAHETRHVLQLAAVARDIQVNNTIAETTMESSTQDSTIATSAEVLRLNADNERLHFELLQAQARTKELMAAMEEKQQQAASSIQKFVAEARDICTQYYEERLRAMRKEMDDMIEEYESRLEKAAAPHATGTPSRGLQNKITQLMTEIAILEEKLTAEKLARARAEEEVQHLRACIEERDDKADEENAGVREDVMLLTDDSEDESDGEQDPCNETLEPTFKKEDINRSRLLKQNDCIQSLSNSIGGVSNNSDLNNTQQTLENVDENDTMNNDTVKDDADNTKENTEISSAYILGRETATKTDSNVDKCDSQDFAGESIILTHGKISIEHHSNEIKDRSFKNADDLLNNKEYNVSDVANRDSLSGSLLEKCIKIDALQKSKVFTRGTYCIKNDDSNDINKSPLDNIVPDKNSVTEMPKEPVLLSSNIKKETTSSQPSEYLISTIIKSLKTSQTSDSSLMQFEQLEMAANNCNDVSETNKDFENLNCMKVKRTYFDDNSKNNKEQELLVKPNLNRDKKTYFDNIDLNFNQSSNTKVSKTFHDVNKELDDTRSPSIVKDDFVADSKLSTMSILLGESLRQPDVITSVHKNKLLPKKHESVDLFEGMDSPLIYSKTPDCRDNLEKAKSVERPVLDPQVRTSHIIDENKLELSPKQDAKQLESARNSFENLALDTDNKTLKTMSIIKEESKLESSSIRDSSNNDVVATAPNVFRVPHDPDKSKLLNDTAVFKKPSNSENESHMESHNDNTIDAFDKIYKDISISRTTEFELLVSQDNINSTTSEQKSEQVEQTTDENKHNFRQNDIKDISVPRTTQFELLVSQENINSTTIDQKSEQVVQTEDENKYNRQKDIKDISVPRATQFQPLRSQDNINSMTSEQKSEHVEQTEDEIKYNLRQKAIVKTENVKFAESVLKEEKEEVLLESHAKCESKPLIKRSLRLRRRKNVDSEEKSDAEAEKLKDIVNLQKAYADITLNVPVASPKEVKDIPSPEKLEEENVPPSVEIQSCPSKSVTRSRRKLFTPRAEPLDESGGPGDSSERVYVPRPSYHRTRTRARRKL